MILTRLIWIFGSVDFGNVHLPVDCQIYSIESFTVQICQNVTSQTRFPCKLMTSTKITLLWATLLIKLQRSDDRVCGELRGVYSMWGYSIRFEAWAKQMKSSVLSRWYMGSHLHYLIWFITAHQLSIQLSLGQRPYLFSISASGHSIVV